MNNLRNIHMLCLLYSRDHNDRLPPSYAGNPSAFLRPQRDTLRSYMEPAGFTKEMWYCPSLIPQAPKRTPEAWEGTGSQISIGYVYLGNPTESTSSYYKFTTKPPYQDSFSMVGEEVLAADFCTSRPKSTATKGDQVTRWTGFAHDGLEKPRVCNRVFGDGHVEGAGLADIKYQFLFESGTRVYW